MVWSVGVVRVVSKLWRGQSTEKVWDGGWLEGACLHRLFGLTLKEGCLYIMKRMWAVACGCTRAWFWGVSYLSHLPNLNVLWIIRRCLS
jgi:hypothetical protein